MEEVRREKAKLRRRMLAEDEGAFDAEGGRAGEGAAAGQASGSCGVVAGSRGGRPGSGKLGSAAQLHPGAVYESDAVHRRRRWQRDSTRAGFRGRPD